MMKMIRSSAERIQIGNIYRINLNADTPDWPKIKRFCGLPNGVRRDPRTAAMFSMLIAGRM